MSPSPQMCTDVFANIVLVPLFLRLLDHTSNMKLDLKTAWIWANMIKDRTEVHQTHAQKHWQLSDHEHLSLSAFTNMLLSHTNLNMPLWTNLLIKLNNHMQDFLKRKSYIAQPVTSVVDKINSALSTWIAAGGRLCQACITVVKVPASRWHSESTVQIKHTYSQHPYPITNYYSIICILQVSISNWYFWIPTY